MSEYVTRKIGEWKLDPILFVKDNFGVECDAWQKKVLMDCVNGNRVSMKACKGPGKTCVLAWLAWWFLVCFDNPKIAATSISADNLSDGLWTEMAKWKVKSLWIDDHFDWTKTRIFYKKSPETWWMSARTWPKTANRQQQADTLAGLHAENLLFIIDEAGGVPDAVAAAAEAGISTVGGKKLFVIAGNPTHLEGPLYRSCTNERHLWSVTEITSDPDDPMRTPRVSIKWAREQIEKYGKENPFVLVNVFGQFPPSSLNTLLGPDEVRDAMNRKIKHDDYMYSQKRIGVDVARFGDDKTILFPRQGLMSFNPIEMRNARSNEIAARVVAAKYKWGSEVEFIDGTGGYGGGVIDSMIQAGESGIEVNFAGKAQDSRYHNTRAEMWFRMAEWIKRGGSLPNIPELARELTAPTYTFQNGKFLLEKKQQVKDRLGFSPDYADALALTFAWDEMPTDQNLEGNFLHYKLSKTHKMKSDFDPYEEMHHSAKNTGEDYDPFA